MVIGSMQGMVKLLVLAALSLPVWTFPKGQQEKDVPLLYRIPESQSSQDTTTVNQDEKKNNLEEESNSTHEVREHKNHTAHLNGIGGISNVNDTHIRAMKNENMQLSGTFIRTSSFELAQASSNKKIEHGTERESEMNVKENSSQNLVDFKPLKLLIPNKGDQWGKNILFMSGFKNKNGFAQTLEAFEEKQSPLKTRTMSDYITLSSHDLSTRKGISKEIFSKTNDATEKSKDSVSAPHSTPLPRGIGMYDITSVRERIANTGEKYEYKASDKNFETSESSALPLRSDILPEQLEREPTHQSWLWYKFDELRPVKFFPDTKYDFKGFSKEEIKKESTESIVDFSQKRSLADIAGPDLFLSRIQEEAKNPFIHADF